MSNKFYGPGWLIEARGELTKDAFAKILKISTRHYYRYENGEKAIPPKVVDAVLRYLKDKSQEVADPKSGYDLHGGWIAPSIEELAGVPRGLGMGKAVDLLGRIYASRDANLIRAIYANLEAFCSGLDQKELRVAKEEDYAQLEARVAELEKLIAGAGGCAMPERRSGADRRVSADPAYPTEQDRRTGTDRRRH